MDVHTYAPTREQEIFIYGHIVKVKCYGGYTVLVIDRQIDR